MSSFKGSLFYFKQGGGPAPTMPAVSLRMLEILGAENPLFLGIPNVTYIDVGIVREPMGKMEL